jgi:mannose-1-phosphate guanylyltransferase
MIAIVLVGGFGTRLQPLTLTRPKQLLPVLDRPMVEWVVQRLAAAGADEIVLSLGYLPSAFEDAYPDGRCAGARLHYATEPEPLDTAGAIRFAAAAAGLDRADESFVVVNGDVLTDGDLPALLALHRRCGAEATIALTPVDDPSRYGVVPIDSQGRVTAFIEKPPAAEAPSRWINAGTYVLEPSVLARIPDGRRVSIERETFPALVAAGSLYARQDDAYWIDAGTPETYHQVQFDLLRQRHGGSCHTAPSATVAEGANVERSVLMESVSVEAGATVRNSILLPGAHVGAGAVVADSLVGWSAAVGPGAHLSAMCVLGEGAVVAGGERLAGERREGPGAPTS